MARTGHEGFEHWMQLERHYAKLEQDWVRARDYTWAERCHKLRWRCMDLAVEALGDSATPRESASQGVR